jgi:hypothetical protein
MSQTIGTTLDAPPPLTALAGELALRIRGGDYHGRVVRIRASQCTVGSAPDCTLRLSGPGLRPLHCIILRGEAGATVRRWSPDTQLNGRAFSDALLMPGDRLSVGSIELEVLEDGDLSPQRRPEPGATVPVAELAQEVVSQLRRDLRRKNSASKSKVEKRRLRQSQRRIKSLEAELERLQANVNALAALDQPAAPQTTSEDAENELQAQRVAWDAERQSLIGRLQEKDSVTRQLSATIDDLRKMADQHTVADRQQREETLQWQAERQSLLGKLQEREGFAQHLQSTLDELRRSIEHPSSTADVQQVNDAHWQAERQTLLGRLQEKEGFAHHLQSTVDELRRNIDHSHLAAAAERQQLQDGLQAEQQQAQARNAELAQLQARCEELTQASFQHQQGEAAANAKMQELHERIATLEAARQQQAQEGSAASEAFQAAQRQLHETFAECERLREELHQANCSLAAAQCRLSEQEAALTAFREMHHHAIAELELECKTLQAQLADAQTKFDEQTGRLAELESQAKPGALVDNGRIAELEAQLQSLSEQVASANRTKEELQRAAEQSSAEWSQREQESNQRVECLERLAANLEDELRKATVSPDKAQAAEQQCQSLEQQLATAKQQWNQQRQELEEQALSAHQQIQDMENQVASMRDALHTTQAQVRERDQLLAQLRDEVRQQMGRWQQERAQLQEQLTAAGQICEPSGAVEWVPESSGQPSTFLPSEPADHGIADERYNDRHMLAGRHALAEAENSEQLETPCSDEAASSIQDNAGDVLSRWGAAGIWRHPEEVAASNQQQATAFFASAQSESSSELPVVHANLADTSADCGQPAHDQPNITSDDVQVDTACGSVMAEISQGNQPQESAPAPAASREGPDEEESIEAYMARLLKRVRGDAVANAFVEQQAVVAADAPPVPAAASGEPTEQTFDSTPAHPIAPEEFLPRKSAPEQATDVQAMRELANQSARQAITRSSQVRFQRRSLATTLSACGMAALSVGLFAWAFDTGNRLAWSGSAISMLGSGYLVYLRMKTRRLLKPAS